MSVENLDEVGLQNTEALQQETATAQDGKTLGVFLGDHSDHGTSNELMNPLPGRIRRFLGCAMI